MLIRSTRAPDGKSKKLGFGGGLNTVAIPLMAAVLGEYRHLLNCVDAQE